MISSTSFRNKAGKPKFGPGLLFSLYLASLAFAFGIGYRLGNSPRSVVATPAASTRPADGSRVSAPSRAADQSRMVWASIQKPKYTLYLASFTKFSDAEKEKTRLESKGLKGVEITEKHVPAMGGNPWYRLSFGRFDNTEAAAEYGRQLTERGLIRDFWTKEIL